VLGEQLGDQLAAAAVRAAAAVGHRPRLRQLRQGPTDPRAVFPADTYRRLQRVKADVDPDDLFLAIHPIPARAA
jgi:hypothetical protein